MSFIADTHKAIRFLQEHGYTEEQAKGFVEVVKEFETKELVTKSDLHTALNKQQIEILKMMVVQGISIIGLTVALIQLLG